MAVLILALAGGVYWYIKNDDIPENTPWHEAGVSILKFSAVLFVVFFIVYFGYHFIIRVSRQESTD